MYKKLLVTLAVIAFAFGGCDSTINSGNDSKDSDTSKAWWGSSSCATAEFPSDFAAIQDTGGEGSGCTLGGFGGNTSKTQADHRQTARTRGLRPVILLHGNAGSATNLTWGMVPIKNFLASQGYPLELIWAPSYMGEPMGAELPTPHQTNINDVRKFIDQVMTYLDVDKVDIIGHSLGGTMARAYMLGLTSSGSWNNNNHRLDKVGTLVTIASSNHGLNSYGDFGASSPFNVGVQKFNGIYDETPWGSDNLNEQKTENVRGGSYSYTGTTTLDNNKITYVALWSIYDFVDAQCNETGRLEGAHLNKGYNGADHSGIIKSSEVHNDFFPYLNTNNTCGNGVIDPGEQCDDGNNDNGDGCDAACMYELCGNGELDPGEQCDDGNNIDNDECSNTCIITNVCGNGILEPNNNEECDDGNNIGGDGCDSECKNQCIAQKATDTCIGHYIAKRIDVFGFIDCGGTHGYSTPVDMWTKDGTNYSFSKPEGCE